MRIGIVVSAQQSSGGIFQYTHSILSALHTWDSSHEFVILVWKGNPLPWSQFSGPYWRVETMDPTIATQPQDVQPRLGPDGIDLLESGVNQRAACFFRARGIDLLVFPAPAALAFECGLPYFMAIHDLQHRLQPEFPEVSNGSVWHEREYVFRNGVRFAQGILVDSEVGKEDVLNFYGDHISPDRLHVLPFLPGHPVGMERVAEARKASVRQRHGLPNRFFFYPAQFWLHKNHSRLIHAIHILRAVHQIDTPLVLTGSNGGGPPEEARDLVFENAVALAEQLGVQDLVHYLGYVDDDEMAPLYSEATALAMPTFFGPTNIPVLEAWALSCPVLSSDIRGIRDQVGDAGVLVNPHDPYAIAEGLLSLWTDRSLRRACIQAGTQRLLAYGPSDFSRRLVEALSCELQAPGHRLSQRQTSAAASHLEGIQLLQESRWAEALECLKQAALENPRKQGIHFLQARCLIQLGRWKDAERATLAELDILPSHPDARNLLEELRLRSASETRQTSRQQSLEHRQHNGDLLQSGNALGARAQPRSRPAQDSIPKAATGAERTNSRTQRSQMLSLYFYAPSDVPYEPQLRYLLMPLLYGSPIEAGYKVEVRPEQVRFDQIGNWQTDGRWKGYQFDPTLFQIVAEPKDADFIVFPYLLEESIQTFGIAETVRLFKRLPHFEKYQRRHVFMTNHDSSEPFQLESIFFRTSLDQTARDPHAHAFPYATRDLADLIPQDLSQLKYQASFVGYSASSRTRVEMIAGVEKEKGLTAYLDPIGEFFGHLPPEVQRIRRDCYLESLRNSLTVLCPRGTGQNTIRFFEAMSAGKIPVLLADTAVLPFEDEIDYPSFTLRIPERKAGEAGKIVHDWLAQQRKSELLNKCRKSRLAWERFMRCSGWPRRLIHVLKKESVRTSEIARTPDRRPNVWQSGNVKQGPAVPAVQLPWKGVSPVAPAPPNLATRQWIEQPLQFRSVPNSNGMIEVNGVQGFLLPGDIHYLFEKAKALPKNAVMVEIGSFMGLSAIIMASALASVGNDGARIFCVDPWKGSPEHQDLEVIKNDRLYQTFLNNVRGSGLGHYIYPIRKPSVEAAVLFQDHSLDLLFVDGDHSLAGCYADLLAWSPKLRPGGAFFGHDCVPGEGVHQAVERFTQLNDLSYAIKAAPDTHYMVEIHSKEPCANSKPGTPDRSVEQIQLHPNKQGMQLPQGHGSLSTGQPRQAKIVSGAELKSQANYLDHLPALDVIARPQTIEANRIPASSLQSQALESCHQGAALLEKGLYGPALEKFNEALRIEDRVAGAQYARALCLERIGRCAEAEDALRTELRLQPKHAEARKMLQDLRATKERQKHSSSLFGPGRRMTKSEPLLSTNGGIAHGTHTSRQPVFKESQLAHQLLDGLKGLEIGPSSHNAFGLNTRNVGQRDEIYEQEQLRLTGTVAPLDFVARADEISVESESEDFVLSSHVVEHCPNLIKTLLEWFRIVKPGGYIYMIVPHRDAAPSDVGRPLTDWQHILNDYRANRTPETEPEAGRFLHCHYHVFAPESMKQFMRNIFEERLTLVASQDVDDKVGNGFALVYRKAISLASSYPWSLGTHPNPTVVPRLLRPEEGGHCLPQTSRIKPASDLASESIKLTERKDHHFSVPAASV